MNVRELIKELAGEDDMDSTVYVRLVADDGSEHFLSIQGIATYGDSYRPRNIRTCTTLLTECA